MKRSFRIGQEFIFENTEAVMELSPQDVGTLALEMTLLLHAMASSLVLQSPGGQRIELMMSSPEKWAKAYKLAPAHLRFELGRNQGEHLQAVLLRAYRDGMAEADHIHLEGRADGEVMDLTLLFQAYIPPMSPEEAAKAMGD